MAELHMGQLLERVVRKKELNITELAKALGVQRRTMYNWFSSRVLSPEVLQRISRVIVYDFEQPEQLPTIVAPSIVDLAADFVTIKNEEYWKDRYIDLLERYSQILNSNLSEKLLDPVLT